MGDAIAHRGPDDSGVWVDAEAGIALGHRRLSIIDLSALGHQPMHSTDGRYVISYNGEVYNFPELRTELERLGHQFKGGSDTEVMLAACSAWGPERAAQNFVGMFAFAVWDRQMRTLCLVRDRIGVKPLYWSFRDGVLTFGSELKALMAHPAWRGVVDQSAVASVVRYSYIPGSASIFHGVRKLAPGTILTLDSTGEPRIAPYWRLKDVASRGQASQILDETAAEEQLHALLTEAIRGRLLADVPLGAFLSGGVDSSTVVALMQAQSTQKVRTFSIGFHQSQYDEAPYAKAVAAHLGTDHTEMYVSAREAIDVIPNLPRWFDEPFADSSQIPTFLVSAMTRKHVTVALSGDGGDELFAGYPRYGFVERAWDKIARAPQFARSGAATLIGSIPEAIWDRAFSWLPRSLRPLNGGRKAYRVADILKLAEGDELYAHLSAVWIHGGKLTAGGGPAHKIALDEDLPSIVPDLVSRMQYYDTLNYLPEDILVKVDRCSMAVGLEAREPLLDHRVVEFAWRLPPAFKLHNGVSKKLLRRVLQRYVPSSLIERPKMGFSIPLAEWLRGPLRDWAESLLSPTRLAADGTLCGDEVRRLWDQHQTRVANRDSVLWNILMIQAWKEHYGVA